jgi:hypothetical protein
MQEAMLWVASGGSQFMEVGVNLNKVCSGLQGTWGCLGGVQGIQDPWHGWEDSYGAHT